MKITFLGTGTSQGVPVIGCNCAVCRSLDFRDKRFRSAIHIQVNDTSLVVDSGPDFRQQMLREDIDTLDALLFTHEHKDHTAGMDDIRSFNFLQGKDMPIYGRQQVIDQLKREFSYVFEDTHYPGVPKVQVNIIENNPFNINGVPVTPIEVSHYKLPVFGFRVGDFTYITDAKSISPVEIKKVKGSKIVVLNALQKEGHISHFTLEEAIHMAESIGAEKTYFTHISHRLGSHQSVSGELPGHINLAYDGLKLTL